MSIEKIERELRQAIDDFSRYPASDERCRGALLEFKATCSTENIRALLDKFSRLREALKPFALVAERDIGEDEEDADRFQPMRTPYNRAPLLTVGDLRAAARVLSEREGQE